MSGKRVRKFPLRHPLMVGMDQQSDPMHSMSISIFMFYLLAATAAMMDPMSPDMIVQDSFDVLNIRNLCLRCDAPIVLMGIASSAT